MKLAAREPGNVKITYLKDVGKYKIFKTNRFTTDSLTGRFAVPRPPSIYYYDTKENRLFANYNIMLLKTM